VSFDVVKVNKMKRKQKRILQLNSNFILNIRPPQKTRYALKHIVITALTIEPMKLVRYPLWNVDQGVCRVFMTYGT
jgi:hypothetical protein